MLFAITTTVYFAAWVALFRTPEQSSFAGNAKELVVVALLCLPLNINGNVFTILGNAKSSKDIYSAFSLYQNAKIDAVSIFGTVFQKADRDAFVIIGIAGYQEAGHDAFLGGGLSGYQKGGNDVGAFFGISAFQKSSGDIVNLIGLVGYQEAGKVAATLCCFAGVQNSGNESAIPLGLIVYQNSEKRSETHLSMALYQRAGTQDGAFAVWSQLEDQVQDDTDTEK